MRKAERADEVVKLLAREYPGAECELDYETPWQLLVATVLSAQCTDVRVNQVTPVLFDRWPGPSDLAGAQIEEIEEVIRPTGFFRNKARSLKGAAQAILVEHDGQPPADLESLVALPGVGRKTAKVVLGEAFGIPAGVTVDTHVRRLSRRIGLTRLEDPEKIATDLEKLVPREGWIKFSLRMILHGRRVCSARRPRCEECALAPVCRQVDVV
jgi:endonuclease-3